MARTGKVRAVALSVVGLLVSLTGVVITSGPAAADALPQSVTVDIDEDGGGIYFEQPYTFDQFDPAQGTLEGAALTWDLTVAITGAHNSGCGASVVLDLSYAGRSIDPMLIDTDDPVTFSFANSATVESGHIGSGTFSPSDLVAESSNFSGCFDATFRIVVTGQITLTYTYEPGASDTTAPTVTAPANLVREATSSAGAAVTYPDATYSDDVGVVTSGCIPASGSTFPLGETTVTCTATDAASNTGTDTFTITVQDTTSPTVTAPADISREATGPDGAAVTYSGATATDAVSGSLTPTCLPGSGSTFPLGDTTVTCLATDAADNVGTDTFTITITAAPDTTAPTVVAAADLTAEATGPTGATVAYPDATYSDDVGVVSSGCVPASGSIFPLGATTVTCTATDAANNTGTDTFTVTVEDTTNPTVVAPDDQTVEATSSDGASVTYPAATASDIVSGALTPSCLPASGDTFPIGSTLVTCTATDAADNVATDTFSVTVQDTTGPVLSLPGDTSVAATSPTGATVEYEATAIDAVDGVTAVTCDPPSGSTFALQTTTVSCSSIDEAGNESIGSFDVTVLDEGQPLLVVPADMAVEATDLSGAIVEYEATATDDVDPDPTVVCMPASGDPFPFGPTEVSCTATDDDGNSTTAGFTVTVADTTAPALDLPDDLEVTASGPDGAVVTFDVTAHDSIRGVVPVTCSPAAGSLFPVGTTVVTCTATDAAADSPATFAVTALADAAVGNVATGTFSVSVLAVDPPVTDPPGTDPPATDPPAAEQPTTAQPGTPPAADPVPPSAANNTLPATGSSTAGLAVVAALLGAGLLAVSVSARRRSAVQPRH